MIVSENSLALIALILAISEIDAWSVVVNPRLSDRETDLIREHSGARRVFYTIEVSDAARQHAERHNADIAVLRGLGTLGVGPLNRRSWHSCGYCRARPPRHRISPRMRAVIGAL
jgi:long-chain acyl-CoA synthetase